MSVELVNDVFFDVLGAVPEASQQTSSDNILSCVPSVDEIRKAVNLMKTGQAPGEDGVLAELL